MPATFQFKSGSAIIADARRDFGGTGSSTDAQSPDSDFVAHLNRAILEMQNFMDDVDTQFMTLLAPLANTAGTQSPLSGTNRIPIYFAASDATLRFNIPDFRRAIRLWHYAVSNTVVPTLTFEPAPLGMESRVFFGSIFTPAKYFSVTKHFTGVGEYVVQLPAVFFMLAQATGELWLEYSVFHPEFTTGNIGTLEVQMSPAFYPLLSLWTAFIALTMLPDKSRAEQCLLRMGMQRIPGAKMSFSETPAYSGMLAGMPGSRQIKLRAEEI